ncbi:hypothetical protein DL96DRAFT_1615753 [Flagelloscypha sp. PMI_526]|nr:hypothetical protein DL96DRAFT_1615753 [Flagelloscypha sp. PMI_526]
MSTVEQLGLKLDAEVQKIDSEITLLHLRRQENRARRNLLTIIGALPDELLLQIFCILRDAGIPSRRNFAWTKGCLDVCSRWRNAAVSAPFLWRHIFEDRSEPLAVVLKRCNMPFILDWDVRNYSDGQLEESFVILSQDISRCQDIRFRGARLHFNMLWSNENSEDPKLSPDVRRLSLSLIETPAPIINSLLPSIKHLISLELVPERNSLTIDFSAFPSLLYSVECLVLGGRIEVPQKSSERPRVTFHRLSALTLRFVSSWCTHAVRSLEDLSSMVPTFLTLEAAGSIGQSDVIELSTACLMFHRSRIPAIFDTITSHADTIGKTVSKLSSFVKDYGNSEPYTWMLQANLILTASAAASRTELWVQNFTSVSSESFVMGLPLHEIKYIEFIGPSHPTLFAGLRRDLTQVHTLILTEIEPTIGNWMPVDPVSKFPGCPYPINLETLVLRNCTSQKFPGYTLFRTLAIPFCDNQPMPRLVIEGVTSPDFDPWPLADMGLVGQVVAPGPSHWNEEEELSDWGSQSIPSEDSESDEEESQGFSNPLSTTWVLTADAPLLDDFEATESSDDESNMSDYSNYYICDMFHEWNVRLRDADGDSDYVPSENESSSKDDE